MAQSADNPTRPVDAKPAGGYWPLAYLAVAAVSIVVYLPALRGLPMFEDNQLIEGHHRLLDSLTTPFLGIYLRPVVSLSFYLERQLWGGEVFMYHQTNIAIHALATLALMAALAAAFGSRRVALAGGLLFAVQPAQVGGVAWIGGRTDSLCVLWTAMFAWWLIRAAQAEGRRRALLLAGAALAYGLAVFTKEQALFLLPLAPLALTRHPHPSPTRGEGSFPSRILGKGSEREEHARRLRPRDRPLLRSPAASGGVLYPTRSLRPPSAERPRPGKAPMAPFLHQYAACLNRRCQETFLVACPVRKAA